MRISVLFLVENKRLSHCELNAGKAIPALSLSQLIKKTLREGDAYVLSKLWLGKSR